MRATSGLTGLGADFIFLCVGACGFLRRVLIGEAAIALQDGVIGRADFIEIGHSIGTRQTGERAALRVRPIEPLIITTHSVTTSAETFGAKFFGVLSGNYVAINDAKPINTPPQELLP
jgi:hypothetical protein